VARGIRVNQFEKQWKGEVGHFKDIILKEEGEELTLDEAEEWRRGQL